MIYKCRKKGIRIYSQVVINQMTFLGNDIYDDHYYLNELSCWKSTNDDLFKGWVRESLQELNTEKDYVKQRIVNLFAELLSVRITCFSIYNV